MTGYVRPWHLLHGWLVEGADQGVRPALLKRGVRLPPAMLGEMLFGGDEPRGQTALPLSRYHEEAIIALMTCSDVIWLVHAAVGDLAERHFTGEGRLEGLWSAAGLRCNEDLRLDGEGPPGDLDLLFGPLRDGAPSFDWTIAAEVKRRVTRADGRPAPPPSGSGTRQANGLRHYGVDMALHILITPGESTEEAWARTPPRPNFFYPSSGRTMAASGKALQTRLEPHVGCVMIGWSHAPGSSPTHHTEAELLAVRPASPITEPKQREKLKQEIARIWSGFTSPIGNHAIIRCFLAGCQQVVPAAKTGRCPACKNRWYPDEDPPEAKNLRPMADV